MSDDFQVSIQGEVETIEMGKWIYLPICHHSADDESLCLQSLHYGGQVGVYESVISMTGFSYGLIEGATRRLRIRQILVKSHQTMTTAQPIVPKIGPFEEQRFTHVFLATTFSPFASFFISVKSSQSLDPVAIDPFGPHLRTSWFL